MDKSEKKEWWYKLYITYLVCKEMFCSYLFIMFMCGVYIVILDLLFVLILYLWLPSWK